jgi:hypothetical protein
MDLEEVACICALELRRRRKRRKQKFWVHPITSQRLMKGFFYTLYEDLRRHPKKFFNYYRMSVNSFDELLLLLRPTITYRNTRWRDSIPPEERLSVTLR